MGTAEARTANRLTYEFVSIASHELRAPIAVVHGIAATLDARVDDLPDEQVHALLRQLVVQTDRLRALADQLLDLSQIESGSAAGPPERFDPLERIEELLPRIAGDRTADVRLVAEPGQVLEVDPVAFDRVAANLILNALRYGAPPVEVRVEQSSPERRGPWSGRGARVRAAPVRALQPQRREPPFGRARRRPRALDRLGLRERARRRAGLRAGAAARRALHAVATGSSKLKREPSPSRDSTQIVPFIRRTSSREM